MKIDLQISSYSIFCLHKVRHCFFYWVQDRGRKIRRTNSRDFQISFNHLITINEYDFYAKYLPNNSKYNNNNNSCLRLTCERFFKIPWWHISKADHHLHKFVICVSITLAHSVNSICNSLISFEMWLKWLLNNEQCPSRGNKRVCGLVRGRITHL